MEHTLTLSSKSQITVPAALRRGLNLRPGDKITAVKRGNEIVLKPSTYDQELTELRAQIEKEVKAKGLWGKPWEDIQAAADEARTAYYQEKYGPRA